MNLQEAINKWGEEMNKLLKVMVETTKQIKAKVDSIPLWDEARDQKAKWYRAELRRMFNNENQNSNDRKG